MHHHATPIDPSKPTYDLAPASVPAAELAVRLDCAELARALYASDMPSDIPTGIRRSGITLEQVLAWVQQGTERLGGEPEVWWLAKQDLRLGRALARGDKPTKSQRAERRQLWPDPKREDQARGLGMFLGHWLAQAGYRWQSRVTVWVRVPGADDGGMGYYHEAEVAVRDLEMAELRANRQLAGTAAA
ncbi:hypothetical protein [Nonomuraea jabiensis]|uniref:hypothetical protein n=1 Tax=Nonomuraea jabiensis TaxID=882448 RepID=UPI003D71ED53